ncbi:uncharacterized protein Z518_08501 [Rhinocladiella mackenziei CBS 650.93]|uniref:FAD/NAD(P)-binding domain-containing protein n=1 Tax=Rhinocladiella mackenziei CBS 650.93 TaxID=1442369 RepID=A0A0D2J125_9EURO|nr:uncharacterized protein Z518_08501 [Rhinocladiella mackenziei CBS 650.93]KIX02560.1 hypothetical protein Z518_08501 [Rhinocladiella mackenziei CBS 650.93]
MSRPIKRQNYQAGAVCNMATPLPSLSLLDKVNRSEIDTVKIVNNWCSLVEQCITRKHLAAASEVFIDDCWWRDILAFSWDITTKHGQESIRELFGASTTEVKDLKPMKTGALQPTLTDMGGLVWIQSGFTFETKFGFGRGFVRLANVGESTWKAWTVFTQVEELKGLDEPVNKGILNSIPAPNGVHLPTIPSDQSLQVLIIGAGQSGLALAAHLKDLGIRALIVDKLPRVGDSWRNRYDSITSHTPIYTDHFPFMKFPSNWPNYLGQKKISNWMEHYSQIMELDIMLNTIVTNIQYDKSTRRYKVEAENTEEGEKFFTPRHVVLATGTFSDKPIRPEFPGEELFKGTLYHTSEHKSARLIPYVHDMKVAMIGCGTSAHDVAQDFVNCGAKEVSIIQRHPIFSFSTESVAQFVYSLWNTPGLHTEDADLIGNSIPVPIARTMNIGATQMMANQDKETLEALEKAGLALKRGEDGVGLLDHQLIKGGHFYIDQGANPMIVDGRIKILRCEDGVKEFYEKGFILGNGEKVEADVVVLATGFHRNIVTVKQMMGEEVAEKVGEIGFLDDEQERIGWWRPTGFPGFWYMTGSFLWCRQFSQFLALQIAAVEWGLNDEYYKDSDN